LKEEPEVTLSDSFPRLPDLQNFAREWYKANAEASSLAEGEQLVLSLSRAVAQAMMEAAVQQTDGQKTYEGTSIPCDCGRRARFVKFRPRWIVTLCGEVEVTRAYYHCSACHQGYLVWDASQGLNTRDYSPGVKKMACQVCGRLHYREAALLIEELTGIRIEESSLEDIVGEVGGRLRQREEQRVKECFEGEKPVATEARPGRLYIGIDAAKAYIEDGWHDVKVGVVYEGEASGRGEHPEWDTKVGGCYVARQEPSAEFGKRIYTVAMGCGLAHAKEVVVMGDGAEWIWNEAEMHFGAYGYVGIVDYFHACEHIHDLAKVLYGEGNAQGQRWATEHCTTLEEKGPDSFIRALKRRKPKTEKQKEAVRIELGYFQRNRKRMNYPAYRQKGMMIGSGPVEAGCRVVVGIRLKGAWKRWSRPGADAMLSVRTVLLNGDYEELACAAWAA
jgi:hypothetical protein